MHIPHFSIYLFIRLVYKLVQYVTTAFWTEKSLKHTLKWYMRPHSNTTTCTQQTDSAKKQAYSLPLTTCMDTYAKED